ncbi:MAG: hypothetical protein J6Y94_03455 [Bacteriovoracaceae bacterium]|nr:hypothetical protein [Bacteriovoracaceae bacterium]
MRPLLTSFQEGNLKKFSPLYHQILKLCAVAPSLTTVHPEPRFREIWQSRLSANQNSIRRSLTDAVNFFNEQNNCAANFTAVPSSSKYLTGKRPMAPKDGNLSFVAQRFSAKNPPAPARPWFSWAKSWQNFWQAWWKKSPQ